MNGECVIFVNAPDLGAQIRGISITSAPGPRIRAASANLIADAIEIADSTARSDIESNFLRNDEGWYNLSDGMDYDWLPQILRYLTARGMIERMTGDNLGADLVRFVKRG